MVNKEWSLEDWIARKKELTNEIKSSLEKYYDFIIATCDDGESQVCNLMLSIVAEHPGADDCLFVITPHCPFGMRETLDGRDI